MNYEQSLNRTRFPLELDHLNDQCVHTCTCESAFLKHKHLSNHIVNCPMISPLMGANIPPTETARFPIYCSGHTKGTTLATGLLQTPLAALTVTTWTFPPFPGGPGRHVLVATSWAPMAPLQNTQYRPLLDCLPAYAT